MHLAVGEGVFSGVVLMVGVSGRLQDQGPVRSGIRSSPSRVFREHVFGVFWGAGEVRPLRRCGLSPFKTLSWHSVPTGLIPRGRMTRFETAI